MSINIDIWSRGSITEGWGHIIRSIALANFFKKKGHQKVRLIFECDKNVKYKLKKKFPKAIYFSINDNPEKIFKKGSICLVDRYIYSKKIINLLKVRYKKIIIFDELKKLNNLELLRSKDIVIRAQLIANKKNVKSKCILLNGLNYFVINKKSSELKKNHRKKIDIMVMLGGGTGYLKYYMKIAKIINKLNLKLNKVLFVMGHQSSSKEINKISSLSPIFKVVQFVNDPINLMLQSKIGIMSGGYSKYEAAYSKLPSLIVPVKNHQFLISKEFCEAGGGIFISKINELFISSKCLELLKNNNFRNKLSKSTGKLVDGLAMERIYKYIFKKL